MDPADMAGAVRKKLLIYRLIFGIGLFFLVSIFQAVAAPGASDSDSTIVVTVEGVVEALPKGTTNWIAAQAGEVLEPGYQLRTGSKSRATLRLSNLTVLRVGELMEYKLEPSATDGGKPRLDLKTGSAYFFSRDKPQEIQFSTPVASGAIRGTEFGVTVDDDGQTALALIDGAVDLANAQGTLSLSSGEQAVVELGRAPQKTAALDATNIVQWTLYYPAILDPSELDFSAEEKGILADSLAAYRSGDLLAALKKYPASHQPDSIAGHIYYGGLLLAVGLVGQSEAQLKFTTNMAGNPARLADAIRELVAATKFQVWDRRNQPELASEWLAESYYLQSRGQLSAALDAAYMTVKKSPDFGFGWERVAELEFCFGRTTKSDEALKKSLALAPRNAQALALNGFLLSAQNRIAEAIQTFDRAIAVDGALGNAWLGHGLCLIREGKSEAGREDLQVAAALEPNRSLLRSYLGKAFAQTGDNLRAGHELELARQFDPNDPTSLLYLALLHQQENKINEAIRDLEKSEALNDNRSVYRSQMLLDQDAAVRGANLAGIYQDAGMTDVSVREATRAVNYDYANYSAHLFLANSYNQLRDPNQVNLRYETPWLSEYLIANLLSPVGAGTLSQNVSQQEYSKLFEHDGFGVASSTKYLSRGAWTESGSQYGTFGDFGYAVDSYYLSDNGQRPNNDQQQLTLSTQLKEQLTPRDSVFAQVIYYDASAGDLNQYYNQGSANPTLRTKENQEPLALIGYHHEFSPNSHFIALAGRFEDESQITNSAQPVLLLAENGSGQVIAVPSSGLPTAASSYQNNLVIYSAEGQQILEQGDFETVVGARFQSGVFDTASALGTSTATKVSSMTATSSVAFSTPSIAQSVSADFQRVTGYGYFSCGRETSPLQLTAGVSDDWLIYPVNYRTPPLSSGDSSVVSVSPKAGFTWTPLDGTVVRFAYTRSLGGVSFDQSVRLEPGQVAGFNQAFRSLIPETAAGSVSAEKFETFGLALEQKFDTGTYLGVEGDLLDSSANRVIGAEDLLFPPTYISSSTRQTLNYVEEDLIVTLNQLLGDYWSLGARDQLSRASLETAYPDIPISVSSANDVKNDATLNQLTLFALFNHPSGFFARAEALWLWQSNGGYQPALPGDDFWQFNIFAGYRFWHRQAQLQVGLLNLGNSGYHLNPLNLYPDLPQARTFAASFQFNF